MRALLLAGAVALGLTACSRDEAAADNLLAYVPADTPYAVVSAEPLDPALRRAWLEAFGGEQMLQTMSEFLAMAGRNAKDAEAERNLEIARSLVAELGPLVDPNVASPLGLASRQEIAFYGHGLLPVLRMRLDDPAAFEAAVARIEAAAGHSMDRADVAGHNVRRQVLDEMVAYLAVLDSQVVMALTPASVDEQIREAVLGLQRPAQSLAQTTTVSDLIAKYQLVPMGGVGYLDTQRILSSVLAPQSVGDKALLDMADDEDDGDDAVQDDANEATCKAEASAMAAQFPRIVVGGTRLDAKRMDSLSVIELQPEWASQWAAIASPQPGASTPKDALVWFGFGMDPIKTGTLLGKIADRVIANPYQCEQLTDLNEGMRKLKESLNPMAIGMAANFHGVYFSLDSLELNDEHQPESGTGVLALSSPAPAAVWSFAQAQVESLRELSLQSGGESVTLPQELLPLPLPARLLMTDRSIAVAVGEVDDARAMSVAGVTQEGPHPILRYGESGRFYSEFYADLFENGMRDGMLKGQLNVDDDEDEYADEYAEDDSDVEEEGDMEEVAEPAISEADAEAFAAQVTGLMRRFGEALEYSEVRVILTERGIEFQQDMHLR
ncbi:MAG: hypothetical protein KDI56_02160 [Xanthomonadales bacterium]|nr:hypothetical protein [Xanthomonadales bacterium]